MMQKLREITNKVKKVIRKAKESPIGWLVKDLLMFVLVTVLFDYENLGILVYLVFTAKIISHTLQISDSLYYSHDSELPIRARCATSSPIARETDDVAMIYKGAKYNKNNTAYHEMGHVLLALSSDYFVLKEINIRTEGVKNLAIGIYSNGNVIFESVIDATADPMEITKQDAKILFAGYIAESLAGGHGDYCFVTMGAKEDMERAFARIEDSLMRYGFSNTLGLLVPSDSAALKASGKYARLLDEAKEFADQRERETLAFLTEHRDVLDFCASEIVKEESGKITAKALKNLIKRHFPDYYQNHISQLNKEKRD